VAERPRISRYIGEMKAVLSASTGLASSAIGLKATTNEGVGDIGLGLAIAAHAVVLVERP
jgi:2-C-methyl-D-erythritol 2,4-cyclodiphosphate synthase